MSTSTSPFRSFLVGALALLGSACSCAAEPSSPRDAATPEDAIVVDGASPSDGSADSSTDAFVPVVCTEVPAGVRAFYVDSALGDDARAGTSTETAWRSLSRVDAALAAGDIGAGDHVAFARGSVFRGGLVALTGGTEAAPLVLETYGCGAAPLLSALAPLEGWSDLGGDVWQAPCPDCAASLGPVVIDGAPRGMGRFPNADAPYHGYLTIDSHTDAAGGAEGTITDDALAGGIDWTGAIVVIRKEAWVLDRCPVIAQTGGTLTYTTPSAQRARDGFGYFLQDDARTLDAFGEWFHDEAAATVRVHFGPGGAPSGHDVRASTRDRVLDVRGASFVTVRGLSLEGANLFGVDAVDSDHITIEDVEIRASGVDGIHATDAEGLSILRTRIVDSLNDGIHCASCSGSSVVDSVVERSGTIAGMGADNNGNYSGIELLGGFPRLTIGGNLIERNRVIDSGYMGITFDGPSITVRNNFVQWFGLTKDDGGGIYTWGEDSLHDRRIEGNIVLDGIGVHDGTMATTSGTNCIYLDDNTGFVEIVGNTLARCQRAGIFLHNTQDIVVRGNLAWDNTAAQLQGSHQANEPEHPLRRNVVEDNVFVARPGQPSVELDSYEDDLLLFGTMARNVYADPFAAEGVMIAALNAPSIYRARAYGPRTWFESMGFDAEARGTLARTAPYVVTVTGASLVTGGTMDASGDADRVFCLFDGCIHDWASSSPLDGGAARISSDPAFRPIEVFRVYVGLPPVTAGRHYLVRFRTVVAAPARTIRISMLDDAYLEIEPGTHRTVMDAPIDVEILVTPRADAASPFLALELSEGVADLFVDDLEMYDVDPTLVAIDDVVRFEHNATLTPVTITLDGVWRDALGVDHDGSIVLQPYTGSVLVRQ